MDSCFTPLQCVQHCPEPWMLVSRGEASALTTAPILLILCHKYVVSSATGPNLQNVGSDQAGYAMLAICCNVKGDWGTLLANNSRCNPRGL